MNELEAKLARVESELKAFLEGKSKKIDQIQDQVDAHTISLTRMSGGGFGFNGSTKTIHDVVREIKSSPGFEMMSTMGRGRVVVAVPNLIELKTLTSGSIVPSIAETGIAATGRKRYGLVRQLLPSQPIETGSAAFVRETAFTDAASPQVEGEAKSESEFEFEADTAPVRTIAHWTAASKQVLDDQAELGLHIDTSLRYGLERKLEEQILFGDGTGVNFEGLSINASEFDSTILVAGDGWEYADVLGAAALQLEEAGYGCDAFIVSPRVWFNVLKQKDANGQYIYGNPASERIREILWNVKVVPSPAMPNDKFMAGDFANGAHIRMRAETVVDISDEHSDFFTKNLIAIRAEMRAALVKTKPAAFVYGTFSQSPA